MRTLHRKLLRDLWRMRLQALAIGLVIGSGIAVFIMMLGAMASLEATKDAYYAQSRFGQLFVHAERVPAAVGEALERIDGVIAAETRITGFATLTFADFPEAVTARLVSIPERGGPVLDRLVIRKGRSLAPGGRDEVLVSEAFAEARGLRPGDRTLANINGRQRRLSVVGIALSPEFVYAIPPGALLPDDRRFGVLWLSRTTLEAAFDLEGAFNDAVLFLAPGADTEAVRAAVDRLLEPYGGLGAYDRSVQLSAFFVDNEIRQLRTLAAVLPSVFLVVGAFLLQAMCRRLVDTEREQIGVLKAFGYTDRTIAAHYLTLALLIGLLGVVLGLLAGSWTAGRITEIYTRFFRFPLLRYRLEPWVYAVATALGLLAAMLGAWRAVLAAGRLPPAQAMRPPPPPAYGRRGMLGRTAGRMLDQPTLMLLRHLLRWPLRSGLGVLGIAAALALLLAAMQWRDATAYLVEKEFFEARRMDFTVSFFDPLAPAVVQQMARLPGVLRVEPRRSLAVRFRSGNRVKRGTITGLPPRGTLQRVLDVEKGPVLPDDQGILLSRTLAAILGVGRGGRITVETLEDRRRTLELPVSGLFSTYLGTPAYASIALVDRLAGVGDRVGSVDLTIDPARRDAFFRALRESPEVAGVASRAARIRAFETTMAETIDIIVAFYVAFALLLTFGTVFNTGRIALSERGRELASLRLLGYSALEASYVLVGELVLMAILALPLGLALGWLLAVWIIATVDNELFRMPLVIFPTTMAWALLAVMAAALVTALALARRVFRLDLVAVLKSRE